MAYNAKQIVDALREAQHLARVHECRTYVIARGSGLKAVTRPASSDSVVIEGIVPAFENIDAKRVAEEAFEAFPDAKPALERMLDIIDKDGKGRPRDPEFKAEAFEALITQYERDQRATQWVDTKAKFERGEIFTLRGPEAPFKTFWFRLFGLRAGK